MRSLLTLIAMVSCLFASCIAQDWGKAAWADEFNQAAASRLDPTKWNLEIGNLKFNNELQIYCPAFPADRTQMKPRFEAGWKDISFCDPKDGNVSFDGEHLVLRATKRNVQWFSGRINTEGHYAFQYGRIEARIKLPFGPGTWPAFWALGADIQKVGWPRGGEIDVMENVPEHGGLGPHRVRSTLHGPGYSGDFGVRNDLQFLHGGRVDDGFHLYGAIWSPYMIQFYVDDPTNVFFIATPHELPAGTEWAYNRSFFLILNLAIGGEHSWPGPADDTTPNPATMLVDYVRVYKAAKIDGPNIEAPAVTMHTGSSKQVKVKLTSKSGTGRVYLDCNTTAPGVHCSLNPYVVDFSNSSEVKSTLEISAQKSPIDKAELKVTAYTESGDDSSQTVSVSFK
ncbi:MAG TPA: glycoside hydrolase family 16 protein [Candidatus Koribacter sp.]|jgi:beta-glucanase (GH16 family)